MRNHLRRMSCSRQSSVILIVLWLLGLVTAYTMGGLIHILLVIALIMVLVNVIAGRRAV